MRTASPRIATMACSEATEVTVAIVGNRWGSQTVNTMMMRAQMYNPLNRSSPSVIRDRSRFMRCRLLGGTERVIGDMGCHEFRSLELSGHASVGQDKYAMAQGHEFLAVGG